MSKRSVWKGPYVHPKLLKRVNLTLKSNKKRAIKTWSRGSTILPNFVGFTFLVHNGKKFIPNYIKDIMVGKKLGEFSPTRTFIGHKKK
jgi:small subunit ribosomal protein S19